MAENSSGNGTKKYLGSDGLIRLVANIIAKLNTKADANHTHAVDSALSTTSTNPVQNKVVKTQLDALDSSIDSINTNLDNKMNKVGPVGEGSFSMNRASGSTVGTFSFAEGISGKATAQASHAEGWNCTASGTASHAEGYGNTASASRAHAEGYYTTASGASSHSQGSNTTASGINSHAEGNGTTANSRSQHVQGEYNVLDTASDERGTYAHIVGNGTNTSRSNAHTLDWSGNAWFKGNVYIGGTKQSEGSELAKVSYVDETASDINASLRGKADSSHNHDSSYYKKSEIDSKVSTINSALSGKSDSGHNHDSSYYTKTQVDSTVSDLEDTIAGKAESSHTHTIANVSGLQSALDAKAASGHKHTVSQITDITATAEELNYMDGVTSNVQTQLDNLSSSVAGKANSSHSHTITASATDDDVVVLTGTNGTNKVSYSASHANSGVTAGTYKSVTVNAQGHVTSGSNPTTLSGYGITDAYTKTQVDSTVSDLEDAIAGKSATGHGHAISDVTNLQSTLDSKAASNHTHSAATTSAAGFMSAADKTKLNGIATGANKYTLPVANSSSIGGVKSGTDISVDSSGNVSVNNDSHTHSASTITSVNASAITGVLSSSQLPSYVDDVIEGYLSSSKFYKTKNSDGTYSTEITGEAGKIYTDLNTNKVYRWSGSAYVVISDTITLGETSSTAYRGDRGKVAYNHSQATGNPHGTTIAQISGLQSQLDSKASSSHTHNYAGSSSAGGSATSAVKLDTSAGSATQPVYFADGKPVKTTYTLGASVPSGAKFTDTTYGAATTSAAGLMSAADKTKLNGIATGAEVNQNAFAKVVVGETEIVADAKSDSLSLVAGSNVTLTPNAANDSVTITAKDTVYTHPASGVTAGTYKSVTVNAAGHVTGGSNPTTLSGYGITDAAAKSHTHTVSQITDLTATAAELNKLDGVTATTAELNYVDGVTSNIQSQLNSKQASVTGGASTITSSNLTASRALVSNSSGKVAVSDVTSTELSYLDGVTSNVQSQLNGKAASGHTHNYAGSSSAGGAATSANKLATARTISLTGDVAGSVSFDGSANASITTTATALHGVTTAGTGAAYTATVSGIIELTAGVSFIMIPHTNSTTTTPTLNVNSLGAKGLRMRGSSGTGTAMSASFAAWVASGRPVQVTYNGIYWVTEAARPSASDLSGTIETDQIADGAVTAAKLDSSVGTIAVSSTEPTSSSVMMWIQV